MVAMEPDTSGWSGEGTFTQTLLDAIRHALRPGGVLVVGTPNFDALSRRMLGRDWAVLSPLEHLYYFTETTLTRMLTSAGFTGVRSERRYPGWHAAETMNYRYTHAPSHWRARAYGTLVRSAGPLVFPLVQRAGAGDALLVTGYTDPRGA